MSYEFSLHPHRLHELIVQTMHALREHRLYVVANRILLFLDSVNQYLDLLHTSYYKVVVFIDPLQGLYAILLEILWIVFTLLPLDGLRKATTTVSLYIC